MIARGPYVRAIAPCELHRDEPCPEGVIVLMHLFSGGPPLECPVTADSDGSGFPLDLTDPVYLLRHLFLGDMPPPSPYPDCGPAPTADDAGCLRAGCAP